MSLLLVLILGSMFYSQCIFNVIFVSYSFAFSDNYEHISSELQERLPEYRVFSTFINPLNALKLLAALLCFSFIQFKELIRTFRNIKKNGLLIIFGVIFLFLIQKDTFEVSLEGRTIYSMQDPQEIPKVDDLVYIIQEKDREITWPRLLFASSPFAILYLLKRKFF
ncbi:uncharacterized protein LOC108028138 [Drosophila biarmipes]|uniref:uncharacterized protein LOC108028138 n=1 Tax=Drosophila biarmipes TaxID=125945 RepID=UPI0021CCA6CD|nr:uncharacterized protein LOC108028138 [Drosophila biarmipes]